LSQKDRIATYVALLRAVNVGGRNKVEMARLKATFERLGLANVRTFIASGNVIFRTGPQKPAPLRERIEAAIEEDFGFPVSLVLCDLETVESVMGAMPTEWLADERGRWNVMFLREEVDRPEVLEELPCNPDVERVTYVPGAVLWRFEREKASKSRVARMVGTELYKQMTVRNPNTVAKVLALMQEAEGAG
jgi:uncharacterized protein (DUF1697 family)